MKRTIPLLNYLRLIIIMVVIQAICLMANAQSQGVSISPNNTAADPSAMLDVSSTSKGTLITRLTTVQRNAISNPAEGLIIFNTATKCFEAYAYGSWQSTWCATCPSPSAPVAASSVASANQIVWNWNTVSGATGYKWNTTN